MARTTRDALASVAVGIPSGFLAFKEVNRAVVATTYGRSDKGCTGRDSDRAQAAYPFAAALSGPPGRIGAREPNVVTAPPLAAGSNQLGLRAEAELAPPGLIAPTSPWCWPQRGRHS